MVAFSFSFASADASIGFCARLQGRDVLKFLSIVMIMFPNEALRNHIFSNFTGPNTVNISPAFGHIKIKRVYNE